MNIVVFDAECLACSRWVQFLLRADRQRRYHFASIQSPRGQALLAQAGLPPVGLDTMMLVEEDSGRITLHTDAIIRVLMMLGGLYRLAVLGKLIPRFLRDPAYRWVARNRYRILGKRDTCYLPRTEEQWRFL